MCRLANMPGYRRGTLRQPFKSVDYWQKRIDRRTAGDVWIVAEVGGVLVGNGGLNGKTNPRNNHIAELGMGVADDFAGQGIGTQILLALLDTADKWRGWKRIQLEVFVDNEPAVALYQKHGFEIEGTQVKSSFRDGEFVDTYAMARLQFLISAKPLKRKGRDVAARPFPCPTWLLAQPAGFQSLR